MLISLQVTKNTNLEAIRTKDPDLVHVFHEIHCDPALSKAQLVMCEQSAYSTYTSNNQLLAEIEKTPWIKDT